MSDLKRDLVPTCPECESYKVVKRHQDTQGRTKMGEVHWYCNACSNHHDEPLWRPKTNRGQSLHGLAKTLHEMDPDEVEL